MPPSGAYHRRIRLVSDGDTVTGELADDFHHFAVRLAHDGERVVTVVGDAVRYPWTTCAAARAELGALVGAPLARRATEIATHLRPRDNCTHLYDLAGLALVHARRGGRREYHATVPDRADVDEAVTVTLDVDGERRLTWDLDGGTIARPAPYAGVPLRGGFLAWADSNLDPAAAEAAGVLRRAVDIAWGRAYDLDAHETAAELLDIMRSTCFTFSPERAHQGVRMKRSTRDWTGDPGGLLG